MAKLLSTALALVALVVAVEVLRPSVPLVFVVVTVGVLTTIALDQWRKSVAVSRFRQEWGVEGKDLLLVYSNSPHWRTYVEETWLPRWGQRAVVLNWSERSTWTRQSTAEAALFRAFSGDREFNPLAIVVPASRHVQVVRFWRAFRAHKHGKTHLLEQAEAELERYLRADTTA